MSCDEKHRDSEAEVQMQRMVEQARRYLRTVEQPCLACKYGLKCNKH